MGRLIQVIAISVAIMPVPGSVAHRQPLSYIGIVYGHKTATVQLVKVASLTAVWLGASANAVSWIQAGLTDSPPYAYIETGRNGHQVTLREWAVPQGHTAHIRLRHVAGRWRVIIDGTRSRWFRLRHAVSITVLETDGPAVAYINGHRVSGG